MTQHMQQHTTYPIVSHELFGFDILLDESLKPWLLEVNISPSLQSGTELDRMVKGPLARDVLNMSGMHVPDKQQISVTRLDPGSYVVFVVMVLTGGVRVDDRCRLPVPSNTQSLDYRVKPLDLLLTDREKAKRESHVAHFIQTGVRPIFSLLHSTPLAA